MILAGLVLGGSEWSVLAILMLGLSAVCVWLGWAAYQRADRWSLAAISGKIFALALLAVCLIEPLWSGVRTRMGANLFVILADDTASLNLRDAGQTTTRGEQLRTLLTDSSNRWRPTLEREFEVRNLAVTSRLHPLEDANSLTFTEQQSPLHRTLQQAVQRFDGRPVAGILLLTDGIATDDRPRAVSTNGWPPIYPVVLGESRGLIDLAVSNVAVSLTAFEDAPVTITAELSHQGLADRTVTAQVLDEKQAVVKEETLRLPAEGRGTSLRFQIRPVEPGLSFYTLRAEVKTAEGADPVAEATLENNQRKIAVERGSGPYRLLYVSGRPNWEYKFLNRALESDEQVKLTALVRIAKREPKFDWRGRAGESNNPLFRGFDGIDAETERFDQPVIVRLNTKDGSELREGFPKNEDELFPFHAVIIDDLEAEFFTTAQLELLERFVSERGGSLLMLGGQESFIDGGYRRTPLARVLPISLDDATTLAISQPTVWKLNLTRDGWLQPWARLRSTEEEEQARLKTWPAFRTVNRIGREKPGANVIAEAVGPGGDPLPAVVAHRFGAGRCAAVLIGDFWRAALEQSDDQRAKDDLGKSWRQLVRWLIADVPERITLKSVPADDAPGVMRLEARIRTAAYQPQDNCGVQITVTLPDGQSLKLPAEPSLTEAGLYEAVVTSSLAGVYRAEVTATDDAGKELGGSATGWTKDPLADEFRRIAPEIAWLDELAKSTGGEVLRPAQLEQFVSTLSRRPAPITEATTSPLWQHPLVLCLIIAGLCGDWGWRRWRGLP